MNKIGDLRKEVDDLLEQFPKDRCWRVFKDKRTDITRRALEKIANFQGHAPTWAKELLRLYVVALLLFSGLPADAYWEENHPRLLEKDSGCCLSRSNAITISGVSITGEKCGESKIEPGKFCYWTRISDHSWCYLKDGQVVSVQPKEEIRLFKELYLVNRLERALFDDSYKGAL